MRHRIWTASRVRAAVVAALAVGLVAAPLAAPTPAAAGTIKLNTNNQSIALLLIHGFNDSCAVAWDSLGTWKDNTPLPQPNSTAHNYLAGQFTNIKEVGYYSGDGTCGENLNNDPSLTQCNGFPESAADYGARLKDRLDRLSCLFAWYIYDNYTQYGKPVNVLAHSMGGLLTRYALGATAARDNRFPPVLWVNNAVTVATPHGGVWGAYHTAAALSGLGGVELDMMDPGNPAYSFMSTIAGYQRPQGFDGTRWALIGASDASNVFGDGGPEVSFWASQDGDGVVVTDSQMSMTADYKVEYGAHTPSWTPGNVADLNTQYEHETLMGCFVWKAVCFNGPYYLNDSSTASTMAWTCSGCAGRPGGNPVAISRSLATIASQLQQKLVPGLANCVTYGGPTITGPDSCAGTFSRHSIWFSGAGLGLQGREIWTWANGSVQDSTATYQLAGLSTRFLTEVDAFIPRYHSNATHVHYTVCAPGNGCANAYVNQSPYYDQWTVVGYLCTTDGTATITVADNGGDRYPRQIAADAIKGVSTRLVC